MRIGIDLGGTKIEIIALDRGGETRARERVPTPQGDYEGTIRAMLGLVGTVERQLGLEQAGVPVGVGVPGALAPGAGAMKCSNSVVLIGKPLEQDLSRGLGRPVRLANDADCFALSEAVDGAAARYRTVFGVILGTGAGSGLVMDRRPNQGPNGVGGEWGHNSLPWMQEGEWPGPDCYCGKRGCVETFVSGTGLARRYADQYGGTLTGREIVALAEGGDARAAAYLDLYEDRLARALGVVINLVDPHCIVLGGGVSNLARLYSNIPPRLAKYVYAGDSVTPVVKAVHGDSSGVRGAAWLWPREGEAPVWDDVRA
ncbi:MAG: ROK family protein [Magnetococcales bacterium]|nr:ROK family protein [Magnetococcales bacterium]